MLRACITFVGVTPTFDTSRLAGAYRLRPGRRPAIAGERPVLEGGRLAGLLRGQAAPQAPARCAALFTLCAHAHRRACAAAIAAASDGRAVADAAASGLLQFETARDHLRAIALEWPARRGQPPRLEWLRAAPLRIAGPPPADATAAGEALHALADWLASEVLHQPVADWLARCRDPGALRAWCGEQAAAFAPAGMLLAWHAVGERLHAPCEPLPVLHLDAATREERLRSLARSLAGQPDFAQRPHWLGHPCETGPWARQRHDPAAWPATAWTRLAARWIELLELAAWPRATLLQQGALRLAPGEAIAWCEMARGLLFHWVRLDAAGVVQDYRVLAPTEWNFHPAGSLARALERLDPRDAAAAALLGAAFDACVPCGVEPAA